MQYRSTLPEKATKEQGIAMLHDLDFFLHCNPHLSKFETLKPDEPPAIPDAIKVQQVPGSETKSYSVTDLIHTLPAGLWDSNVVSTYEITKTTNGLFVRIKSPMSIVMDTVWEIKAGKDGALEIFEEIEITCSRLLVGVVKSQCDGGWGEIHAKMLGRLKEEVQRG